VFFLAFIGVFMLSGTPLQPNGWILLTPVLLLMMAGLGFGFGIIISSLTTKYRDLRFLVVFGVQLLMYATPVIYSTASMPAQYQVLIQLNPLSSVVEAFRYAYIGGTPPNGAGLIYSFGFMLVAILVGTVLFNRVETTFMDTV
jgi:lipopolysaccharide transport system permease protein